VQIRGVIFDCDGLLLDTERVGLECWERAAGEFHHAFDDEIRRTLPGLADRLGLDLLKGRFGSSFDEAKFVARAYELFDMEIARGVSLKRGALDLIEYLERLHLPFALATSAHRGSTIRKLKGAGLLEKFRFMVNAEDVRNHKPAPDVFLASAIAMKVPIAQCVVLEDSLPGVVAAHAAGATPVMVPDLVAPTDEIRALAYAVVPSLIEARELIAKLCAV
jgi:HAD superfamily hydrolase (TIGR01509 family)